MTRVLLVANKTLGSPEIAEFVKQRMERDGCRFTLLVPATPRRAKDAPPGWLSLGADVASVMDGARPELARASEDDYAQARSRLEYGLELLRSWGATVDGEVGDPDPAIAVRDVLAREHFDEVAIGTLPRGVSHWLRLDLPHQVERKFRIPVTVITVQ